MGSVTMKQPTVSIDLTALQEQAKQMLDLSQQHGATQAEVSVSASQGFDVNVRNAAVETLSYHDGKQIQLTFYMGLKKAMVSSSDTDPASVLALVKKACTIAQYAQEDNCHGLADANLMAKELMDLDLYHPWAMTPQQAIEQAIAAEAVGLAYDKCITASDGVELSQQQTHSVYANSHGFMAPVQTTKHGLSCVLIAKAASQMERDYDYSIARDARDLLPFSQIAEQAAARTIRRLSPQKIKTCRVPVLFEARIAHSLLGHFLSAISGRNLYRQSSFLLDSLNKPIFADHIDIDERPHLPKALGSAAFDSEGVATQNKSIVSGGVLNSYLLGSYSARKLKRQTTANAGGVHNLLVKTSDHDLPALLKKMDRGLLVTELMGDGVNLVTGDYSQGICGFWVENGNIQYPVAEMTVASNLREMFRQIIAIGNDINPNSAVSCGSILLEEMTVAGN